MKIVTLSFALVLASFAAVPANAADRVLFIGEDFEGNIVSFYVDATDHATACPAPNPCVSGPHVRDGWGVIGHGFYAPLNGVYSSTLADDKGNARTFTCHTATGPLTCQGQGTFPAMGATFHQVCAFGAVTGGCRIIHF